MNLNNLPKDMLVELVSNIRDEVEKEHCDYIVIHSDNYYEITFEEYKVLKELKEFLLSYLIDIINRKIIFGEEEIKIFTSCSKNEYLNYVNILGNRYSLEELIKMVSKVGESRPNDGYWRIHRIMKGKMTYNDGCQDIKRFN